MRCLDPLLTTTHGSQNDIRGQPEVSTWRLACIFHRPEDSDHFAVRGFPFQFVGDPALHQVMRLSDDFQVALLHDRLAGF